jgi:hypothetical protein
LELELRAPAPLLWTARIRRHEIGALMLAERPTLDLDRPLRLLGGTTAS